MQPNCLRRLNWLSAGREVLAALRGDDVPRFDDDANCRRPLLSECYESVADLPQSARQYPFVVVSPLRNQSSGTNCRRPCSSDRNAGARMLPRQFEIGSMILRVFSLTATAALALGLWVVPSVGTRGQGTLGDRFAHVDRAIVADDTAAHESLARADNVVVGAVAAL